MIYLVNTMNFFVQHARFDQLRDSYFDVTAVDSIDAILVDSKKSKEAREEDVEFVRRLRRNEFVAFGGRDWDQQKRFYRTAAREDEQAKRQEKEKKRKLVCS